MQLHNKKHTYTIKPAVKHQTNQLHNKKHTETCKIGHQGHETRARIQIGQDQRAPLRGEA